MKLTNGRALLLALDAVERALERPVRPNELRHIIYRSMLTVPLEMRAYLEEFVASSSWTFLVLDKFREEGDLAYVARGGYTFTPKGREIVTALIDSGLNAECIKEAALQLAA